MHCPTCADWNQILLFEDIVNTGRLNGHHDHEKQASVSRWGCAEHHEFLLTAYPACPKCGEKSQTRLEPDVDAR